MLVSGSVKGRCHGIQFQLRNRPKSATRLPSWHSHSTTDGRIGKRMGALTAQKPCTLCRNLVNFGPLTLEFTVMVWRPFMRQMRKIGETREILETCIRQRIAGTAERICTKFTLKTCLILRSDEFEYQGQKSKVTRDKERAVHSQHPRSMDEMERPRCR